MAKKTDPSKIDQLVAEARIHLRSRGIDTEGKRSDEILNMARRDRITAERAGGPSPKLSLTQ